MCSEEFNISKELMYYWQCHTLQNNQPYGQPDHSTLLSYSFYGLNDNILMALLLMLDYVHLLLYCQHLKTFDPAPMKVLCDLVDHNNTPLPSLPNEAPTTQPRLGNSPHCFGTIVSKKDNSRLHSSPEKGLHVRDKGGSSLVATSSGEREVITMVVSPRGPRSFLLFR
jgi:hypothetical protein